MTESERALHVLIELQELAAEQYWRAHRRYDTWLSHVGTGSEDIALGVLIRTQEHAAALSRLVRIGLGVEP